MYCNSFACCFSSVLAGFFIHFLHTKEWHFFQGTQCLQHKFTPGGAGIGRMIPAGPQYCCSCVFLIWTSHGVGVGPGSVLGLRDSKTLQVQGHWCWNRHAKVIIPRSFFVWIFTILNKASWVFYSSNTSHYILEFTPSAQGEEVPVPTSSCEMARQKRVIM